MKWFLRAAAFASATALALSLGACKPSESGGNESGSSSGGSTAAGSYSPPDVELENKKLRVMNGPDIAFEESTDGYPTKDEIMRDKYGVEIEFIGVDWNAYMADLMARYMSDDMPDVFWQDTSTFPNNIINHLLQPIDGLEPYIDINDSIWDAERPIMQELTINGKHYFPIHQAVTGMFTIYNPKVFELSGLETPYEIWKNNPDDWNWDKMLELARAVTADTDDDGAIDQWGVGLGAGYDVLAETTGVAYVTYDDEHGAVNHIRDPEVADAANFVRDLGPAKYNVMPPCEAWEVVNEYMAGHVVMDLDYEYKAYSQLSEMGRQGKMEVAPLPKYPKADKFYSGGDSWGYGIANKAKNPEGAALYISVARYRNDQSFNDNYNRPKEDWLKYLTDAGLSLEMSEVVHAFSRGQLNSDATFRYWIGWFDGSNSGMNDLKDESWAQILERVGPYFDAKIEEKMAALKEATAE